MIRRSSAFILGTVSGFLLPLILVEVTMISEENTARITRAKDLLDDDEIKPHHEYNTDLRNSTELSTPPSVQDFMDTGYKGFTSLYDYQHKGEEVAREMAKEVRILCWIATLPSNHKTKAEYIRDTWGKRCNVLLFMSSKHDNSLPAVALDVDEGREHLFDKTKAAFKYIYNNYKDSIDWILKADDDTFVVVENLRYMLSTKDPSKALYLGCRFKPFAKQGFMSGGAGYVLSRAALIKFVEEAIPDKSKCLTAGPGEGEDVQIGKCLENVNVTAIDSRDYLGRGRFFPYTPEFHLFPDHHSQQYLWYWEYQYYPDSEGLNCCSDTAVSFHYVSPNYLQVLYYLMYTLLPHGNSLYYRNRTMSVKT